MARRWTDNLSLRSKATGTALLVLTSALITVAAAGIWQMRRLVAEEETRTVQAVARGIGRASELALAVGDDHELARILERFMRDDQILLIAIYDSNGRLAARSVRTPDLWERYLHGRTAQDDLLLGEQPVDLIQNGDEFAADGIESPSASQPRRQSSRQEGGIGRVVVGLSTAPAIQAQEKQTRLTSICTLLAGGLSILLVYMTVGTWTRRLNRLVLASERIAQGDLSHSVDEGRGDEMGRLSGAYEQMRQAVQQRNAELHSFNETLKQQVQERTHSLTEALASAQAADRAKSRFLAAMSHEIRTPLNGIVGMVDLLRGTELNENQLHYAQVARSSTDALLTIINDVLDFSKIEAGRMELEAVEFDLNGAMEDLTETAALAAARKGLELACVIHPEVPNRTVGDPGRLRQIMTNLINNSIKFTEHGQIVVRVALVQQDAGSALLRFSVSDTGIGIPEDRRNRLFQSFSQVDASTTRKYGGTGLGLAISKRLAELMGGAIGVDSQPGAGSTFWFTARMQTSAASEAVPEARRHLLSDLRKIHVLAVDDSAVNREILQQQLATWKLDVQTAADGPAALVLLEQSARDGKPFQLVILDWHMPDMDGIQLAQAIRANPALRDLTLIMLTSIEDQVRGSELRDMGFAAYLIKPVRQARLFDAITEAMRLGGTPETGSEGHTPAASAVTPPAAIHGDLHVLLAEDNEINQMVASEILIKSGFTCDIVDNGRRAFEAAFSKAYDVILMDCQMPEMDGFEAARAIRQYEATQGRAAYLPIIALTANAIKGDREQCIAAGMDDYVVKPINPQDLLQAIHAAVTRWPRRNLASEPAPAGDPSDLPVNLDELCAHCMNNTHFAVKTLTQFQEQINDEVLSLARAVTERRLDETAKLAHGLKCLAANLSAGAIRAAAAAVEQLSRNNGDAALLQQAIDRLQSEVERCLAYIPQAIGTLATRKPKDIRT